MSSPVKAHGHSVRSCRGLGVCAARSVQCCHNAVSLASTRCADEGVLTMTLAKARKAETWPSVFKGHGVLDPAATTDVQRQMLLERFQSENPGFDFSGAEVTGSVPDPRTFMGGPRG